MYRILERQDLTPNIHLFKIDAPRVAAKARAGQFVILRQGENGERIPLTLADWNKDEGSVTVVFMEVGLTTKKLALLQAGDALTDFAGPLGLPTHIENYGTVVCVAGGFAVATIMPIARALKEAGNRVITIMGARSQSLLFWEKEVGRYSDELIVITDDGSNGRKGLVTEPLRDILAKEGNGVTRVIAIGPTVMMKFSSKTSEPFKVKTIVSLNPIMVDGTGMCGCCRVSVGGVTRFACVDGPDFDGHEVDWDELMARQRTYLEQEASSLAQWQCQRGACAQEAR
ncbi:MAG: sulfide/dihydroorotate dehydrogenase-like FAD/NAD-binding protein [Dehalococcoidia bacterium]|nr:MAG: sulfide/dihydroorotate dehydrogenase-like FAD/NAD-binding protein [Dehalococcoidia bacterium]